MAISLITLLILKMISYYTKIRAFAHKKANTLIREVMQTVSLLIIWDHCIIRHSLRYYRHSGLVIYKSKLPAPSVSMPCDYRILQSSTKEQVKLVLLETVERSPFARGYSSYLTSVGFWRGRKSFVELLVSISLPPKLRRITEYASVFLSPCLLKQ